MRDKKMDKHLSSQFDIDLHDISEKLLEMGKIVENQLKTAMLGLDTFNESLLDEVFESEIKLNQLEIDIDGECNNIIVKRQPIAKDLRLVMAISKAITNLERAGDEAVKIAKCTRRILKDPTAQKINFSELKVAGKLALDLLHRSLDAFAKLDINESLNIVEEDKEIDEEFRAFVRKLVTYMMEDPKTISTGLDFLFLGKAIERIGDHAKNIAEFVIYIVKGTDIRHKTIEEKHRQAFI
jgi:phosphate transport system protein